jgi:photosystem II stability/assembly factor-like uncharacterized protein
LKTTNGGLNWSNLYANVPPTSNGANALLSIYFANTQTGWMRSNVDKKNIYKTTNGGANCISGNPVALCTYTRINDVKSLTQEACWAHGIPFSGAIMFTITAEQIGK